jgi:predicted membrane protein
MFEKLKQKWKVNALQLALILFVFAIGGSLTGFAGKKIMNLLTIEADWLWAIVYIILITIIWPIMVIVVSIPFGQFRFFSNYTKKLGQKLGIIRSEKESSKSQKSYLSNK